jgi:hypothetical protein
MRADPTAANAIHSASTWTLRKQRKSISRARLAFRQVFSRICREFLLVA